MIIDLNDLPDDQLIEADLCIIGAGAAGISIANEFSNSNVKVCLLESGDMVLNMDTQKLYDVEDVGVPLDESLLTRLRVFGGTTNHWDGRCAPFNDIDFQKREWVPFSGWPFQLNELQPYYDRANENCDLGNYENVKNVFQRFRIPESKFDPELLKSQIWKFSTPTRFGPKYKTTLSKSHNIDVILNANVTRIKATQNGSAINGVSIASLSDKRAEVRAKQFILCCGGIENPRLLLLSNDIHTNGLGNNHDLVGRFFMEHLRSKASVVHFGDPYKYKRTFNTYQKNADHYIVGMRTSNMLQKEKQLLNAGALNYFEGNSHSATHSFSAIRQNISNGNLFKDLDSNALNLFSDLDEFIINTRRRFLRPDSNALIKNITVLSMDTEQAPNPDSRISLSDEVDRLGLRRSKVDWRMMEIDKVTTVESHKVIAAELARNYQSRFRLKDWMTNKRDDWPHNYRDVAHHMGTTRMSDDPKLGVVNSQCRVHNLENLYIAGSSVFPTSGHVNPTLTIVALALRLADHLKAKGLVG